MAAQRGSQIPAWDSNHRDSLSTLGKIDVNHGPLSDLTSAADLDLAVDSHGLVSK